MKKLLLITLILILAPELFSQEDRAGQAGKVKSLVADFGKTRPKLTVLTRDLIVVRGKISGVGSDYFGIKLPRGGRVIPYSAVLEMSGGGQGISFVPNPGTGGYGSWSDAGSIFAGTRILVAFADGTSARGFSNSATATHLIMIDENGRQRVDVPREKIVAVYGLIGGYGGVKKGASEGAEAMHAGRDKLLGGILTGVGALVGLAKSDGRPILIYSK